MQRTKRTTTGSCRLKPVHSCRNPVCQCVRTLKSYCLGKCAICVTGLIIVIKHENSTSRKFGTYLVDFIQRAILHVINFVFARRRQGHVAGGRRDGRTARTTQDTLLRTLIRRNPGRKAQSFCPLD